MDEMIEQKNSALPEMTPEQAANMAALGRSISESEPMEQISEDMHGEVGQASQEQEIAGVLFTIGQLVAMRFGRLRDVYTKNRCDDVARDLAPVFDDLGWKITGGRVGKYMTAFMALFMLGYETREAIKAELAELAKNIEVQPVADC